jgi:hypothetical protein
MRSASVEESTIVDERDRFVEAMHLMRDAFQVLKEDAEWGRYDAENGRFYDGYAEVKRLFGDVLLQRDVQQPVVRDEAYWQQETRRDR